MGISQMLPSATYVYWVMHAAVIAFLLTALLAALYFATRVLLRMLHRRFSGNKDS